MKKALVAVAVLWVMSSVVAVAEGGGIVGTGTYGAAGCGLGSMVFQDQPGGVQILAATTNNAIFPQTFAISTGTSNCGAPSKTANNKSLMEFAVSNLDNLTKEIAMGQGESLDTMAELLGIPMDQRQTVYAKLQANFTKIFPSAKVEAAPVIDNIVLIVNS